MHQDVTEVQAGVFQSTAPINSPTTNARTEVASALLTTTKRKRLRLAAGVLAAALLLAAGAITFRLQTTQGTLELEINEPGAIVKVLDEKGEVQITRQGEKSLTIKVDPGKHRLIVERDGFAIYTKDFTIEVRGTTSIAARLIPNQPAKVATAKEDPWIPKNGVLLVDDFDGTGPKLGNVWETNCDNTNLGTKVNPFVIAKEASPKSAKGHGHFSGHMGKHKDPWPWVHLSLSFIRLENAPKDLSAYTALRFYAKGDGKKYRVFLGRKAVTDNGGFGYTFSAPREWTLITAPLSEFVQPAWGKPVPRGFKDATRIGFLPEDGDDEDFELRFTQVEFIAKEDPWVPKNGVLLVDNFDGTGPKLANVWQTNSDNANLGTTVNPFAIVKEGSPESAKGHGHFSGHMGKSNFPFAWATVNLFFQKEKDLSAYTAVRFLARGDGKKHRVCLGRLAVEDQSHFEFAFIASKEWTTFTVPLSEFRQPGWGRPVPPGFKDVIKVSFLALAGDGKANDEDFDLRFTQVEFITVASAALPSKLDGEWEAIACEEDGKKLSEAQIKGIKLIFNGDKCSARYAYKLQIDPTKKTLDFTAVDGPLAGKIIRAIYTLEGDTLRICEAAPDMARPTEFSTTGGGGYTLRLFRRVRPTAEPSPFVLGFDGTGSVEIFSLKLGNARQVTLEGYITAAADFKSGHLIGGEPLSLGYHSRDFLMLASVHAKKTFIAEGKSLVRGERSHVAGVWDGKQLRLFLNGRLVALKETEGEPLATNSRPFSLAGKFFIGSMEEVRISKVARYDKEFKPQRRFELDADTLALYHCDEGSGNVLKDSSGNGHHGKIVGATWLKADRSAMGSAPAKVDRDCGMRIADSGDAPFFFQSAIRKTKSAIDSFAHDTE